VEELLKRGLWNGQSKSPLKDETAAFALAAKAGFSEIVITRSDLYTRPWLVVIDMPNVDASAQADTVAEAICLAVLKATDSTARWIDVLVASFDAPEHTALMSLAENLVRDVAEGARPLDDLMEAINDHAISRDSLQ